MKSQSIYPTPSKPTHPAILIASAVLITLFLFYIDEGYYDFRWMRNPGNWLMFVVYVSIFWLSQYFVSRFLLRTHKQTMKLVLSILGGGIAVALIIVVLSMLRVW